jgi:hypothetical protein
MAGRPNSFADLVTKRPGGKTSPHRAVRQAKRRAKRKGRR